MASRPRGGDWLEDEIAGWQQAGIARVLSLLTADEEQDLDLTKEAADVRARGMKFTSLPVPDRGVPNSESELAAVLDEVDADLVSGRNVVVHCRQGIGRSGLLAACLLITKGLEPKGALERISAARGVTVPETVEQSRWVNHYAAILASPRMISATENHGVRSRS